MTHTVLYRLLILLGLSTLLVACSDSDNAKPESMIDVAIGLHQTCIWRGDGRAACWGSNKLGQLGLALPPVSIGDEPDEMGDALQTVDLGSGLIPKQVSAGVDSTCVLFTNDKVKCFGEAGRGQLGLGGSSDRGVDDNAGMGDALPFVDLGTEYGVKALSSGEDFHCALLNNGLVKCWGYNYNGQLGQADKNSRGSRAGEMGVDLLAVNLGTDYYAIAIASGSDHSCVISEDLSVKCWGDNSEGQLGLGDQVNRGDITGTMGDALPVLDFGQGLVVDSLALGNRHSCALFTNGIVKCWGRGGSGELGQGDVDNIGDGDGDMGDALAPIALGTDRTAIAIAAKEDRSCALLDNGAVKCWGGNFKGNLGQGDTEYRGDDELEMGDDLAPIDLGQGRTATAMNGRCALLDNQTLKCWGDNIKGQLGQGDAEHRGDEADEMGDFLAPIDLGSGRRAVTIDGGRTHECAILNTHELVCWGENGPLGLGRGYFYLGDDVGEVGPNLASLDLGAKIRQISLGRQFNCALLSTGLVKCWGLNSHGQLGQGDRVNRTNYPGELSNTLASIDLGSGFDVVKLASADFGNHVCALSSKGLVKCWGYNSKGQLGQGHRDHLGDDPAEMGALLAPVELGSVSTVIDISVGREHSCALFDNGGVKCWGANRGGVLGQGDAGNIGDEPNEMGGDLAFIDLGDERRATLIATGDRYTCALLDIGQVKCWGDNYDGQLGQGHSDDIDRAGDGVPTIELGMDRTAVGLVSGRRHSCALLDDQTVKCWGDNNRGQLGLGDDEDRGDEPGEMGGALPVVDLGHGRTAMTIMAGGFSACAILDDATLKCWGANWGGQLGQGDTNHRGDEPGEMGDNLAPVMLPLR